MNPESAPFAAVLLAGGRSRRFGSDKACYVPPGFAAPLWRLQLDKLSALGAAEVILSVAPSGPGFAVPTDVRIVEDAFPDQGPLGGLASVLSAIESPRVIVLGIDMPGVTVSGLRRLLEASAAERGLVPKLEGRWEPLLAMYPQSLADLARTRLAQGERSLQGFVEAGIAMGALESWPVPPEAAGWFVNLNRPDSS